MALGKLFARSTRYTVTDTVTGATNTFTVVDGLSPDWASATAYRGAMTIPGAWRAALLLTDLLGQVPWHAYRKYGGPDAVEEMVEPNPPLLEQPAPPDPRMATFSSAGLDLLWNGNAVFIIAARNVAGWPTAVVPVAARFVDVRRVTPYLDSPLPVGALEYRVGNMVLSSQDLIHVKGPCEPGALRGMGIIEAHFNTINLAQEQLKQARSISNAGVPTGVITSENPDLTDDEALDLKASWMANQASRTVQVLNSSTKFEPLAWNPTDMQMIEARKFTLTEWENIFGLPVGWLGGQTSSRTYSNIEQDAVNLIKFSLGGHLSRFEQTLSLAFPRGTNVRANLDSVLRADTLTRYQSHALALGNKFLTVDEVREIEHRPPMKPEEKELIADAYVSGQAGKPDEAPPGAGPAALPAGPSAAAAGQQ